MFKYKFAFIIALIFILFFLTTDKSFAVFTGGVDPVQDALQWGWHNIHMQQMMLNSQIQLNNMSMNLNGFRRRCKEGTWPYPDKCPPSPSPSPEEIELKRRCAEGTWPEPENCPEGSIPSPGPVFIPTPESVYVQPIVVEPLPSPELIAEPLLSPSEKPSTIERTEVEKTLLSSILEKKEKKVSFLNNIVSFIKELFK